MCDFDCSRWFVNCPTRAPTIECRPAQKIAHDKMGSSAKRICSHWIFSDCQHIMRADVFFFVFRELAHVRIPVDKSDSWYEHLALSYKNSYHTHETTLKFRMHSTRKESSANYLDQGDRKRKRKSAGNSTQNTWI